ncbi:MAG: hypothetical protein LBS53_07235 [Synergistaceae bacterium]|jgi:hypothetical protein|nr:hypothetical protein [Synergistaceae bacterium]
MSRAFVKEADEELAAFRDDSSHSKKALEYLKLQEKKLDFLLNDPKGMKIEPQKREKWIKEVREAIDAARVEMGKPGEK